MISDIFKTHTEYAANKTLIDEYLKSVSDKDLEAMVIAFKYLKSSFSIVKSNGFRSWQQKMNL
jgi:hypothetical protein